MLDAISSPDRTNASFAPTMQDGGDKKAHATFSAMPEAAKSINNVLSEIKLPTLAAPADSALSLDSLLQAVGFENRRRSVRSSVDSLKTRGDEQKAANDKELREIQKRIDEMEKRSVLNGFLKAFKIIGLIVGAIVSAVSIATGAGAVFAAGIVGAVMTADSALSLASDGKYCLAGAITAIAQAAGKDEETAKKIGTWTSFAISLAAMAFSIGSSIHAVHAKAAETTAEVLSKGAEATGSVAAKAADTASKAATVVSETAKVAAKSASKMEKIAAQVVLVSNIVGGANSIAEGASTVAASVIDKKVTSSLARSKELEALLMKIRQSIEFDQDMIKAEMERSKALMDSVMDIVENCTRTQLALLAANPSMA